MVLIRRNNREFGPYDNAVLVSYVNRGIIVLSDVLVDTGTGTETTVERYLRGNRIAYRIEHAGNLPAQLRKIGGELIIPKESMRNRKWLQDKKLLILAVVGLAPSVLLVLPLGQVGVFYFIALYFSIIWGLFFYYPKSAIVFFDA